MDKYKEARRDGRSDLEIETLIGRIFERSLKAADYSRVVDFAIDAYRIDMLEKAIELCEPQSEKVRILTNTVEKISDLHIDPLFYDSVLDVMTKLLISLDGTNNAVVIQVQHLCECSSLYYFILVFDKARPC